MTSLRSRLRLLVALALGASLLFAGSARADDEEKKVDPVGQWKLKITLPDGQGEMSVTTTLKKDGDKLAGTMVGDDAVETELKDITFEDGELAFTLERDFGGTPLVSKFKGKLTADAFDGNVDYDVGGQTGTAKVEGKRAVEAIAAKGTWKFTIKTPDEQALEPIVKINQEGEAITGTFLGMDGTEVKLEDGTYKDNELAFTVKLDFGGQELIAKFKGAVSAEGYKGTVDYDLGGQTGTLDVTGAREAASLAGKWAIVATSDAGSYEPKLELTHEGDKIEGTYIWDENVQCAIKDAKLEGSDLTFKVEHDFGGQPIVVVYVVTVDGDSLKGKADYDLGGQTGTATIEAKRGGAAAAGPDVSGTWNITLTSDDGQSFDVTAKLEQSKDGLKGTYTGPAGEAEISDASVEGNTVKFKVTRERDGQKFTIAYDGKVADDTLKGTAEADLGGQAASFKFEGKRAK